MTWFKVDDKLHSHMKVMEAGVESMGLWVLAGSWCADQLTDGFIPRPMALRLDPDADEHAGALVDAGLWFEDTQGRHRGWRFHGWEEFQPSREKVHSERQANADRQAKFRERRAAEKAAEAAGHGVRNGVTNGVSNSTPSRPDPSLNNTLGAGAPGARGGVEGKSGDTAEGPRPGTTVVGFDEWWGVYRGRMKAKAGTKMDARAQYAKVAGEFGPERLLAMLRAYFAAKDVEARTSDFSPQPPHAKTWLAKRYWEQYPQSELVAAGGAQDELPGVAGAVEVAEDHPAFRMTRAEVAEVLGGDVFTPVPPDGLRGEAAEEWLRGARVARHRDRQREAWTTRNGSM